MFTLSTKNRFFNHIDNFSTAIRSMYSSEYEPYLTYKDICVSISKIGQVSSKRTCKIHMQENKWLSRTMVQRHHPRQTYCYDINIQGIQIQVYWSQYDEEHNTCRKDVADAFELISIMLTMRKNNVTRMRIYLCLLSIPKEVHGMTVDAINSALGDVCHKDGEIWIYRRDEWRFLLIHELIHVLCLDINYTIPKQNIFQIKSEFYINEAYTDFLATNIHACYQSYKVSNSNDEYILYAESILMFDAYFAQHQAKVMLDSLNMHAMDVFVENNWVESTNVFAYYVLRAVLFSRIRETRENIWSDFWNYIIETYKLAAPVIDNIKIIKPVSARRTCFEL